MRHFLRLSVDLDYYNIYAGFLFPGISLEFVRESLLYRTRGHQSNLLDHEDTDATRANSSAICAKLSCVHRSREGRLLTRASYRPRKCSFLLFTGKGTMEVDNNEDAKSQRK